ncbi:adenosine kinase [Thioalkalicoccus limnaeus]|uniref:Adenosine kinase n=1 Tax=Thioalkalicoccus limnaeus TaxID=120681 RepID=A0ABV4B9S4_9GAMM
MRRYHVYAIGNALVDMEYEVTVEDLERLQIDKGVMTLVDEARQLEIMAHLAERPHKRGSGGSAANTVIAVNQFGGQTFYSCKVADDALGQFYMHDLIAAGVDTNHQCERDDGHTGRCVVLVTPDSDRTMCTFLGISCELSERELVSDALREADYLYTEGYLVTSTPARRAAVQAKSWADEAQIRTAFSLSDPNMVRYFKDGLLEMIGGGVDLLFANEAEAMGMADSQDLGTTVEALKRIAREFAITRGPKGALIYDGQDLIEIPPVKVQAVDTVGAGDMFAGAFLHGLTQGWGHQRAGELACAAAAKLVTSLGPRLPTDETKAVLHRFS